MTSKGRSTAVLLCSVALGWFVAVAGSPTALAVAPTCRPVQEGFESGTLGAFTSTVTGDAPGWSAVTTAAETGTYSAFAPDRDRVTEQILTVTNAIVVPNGIIGANMTFWHRFLLEAGYDGGVLETSIDGGATWQDAAPVIAGGGYNETLQASANPLAGRSAWSGTSPGYPGFASVFVNLESFEGETVLFRFRLATDENVAETGWWIDRIEVIIGLPCEAIPTSTATPTTTASPTPEPTATPTPTVTSTPIPSATPSVTATGAPTPTATATPGPLDHFLCYETHRRQINVKGVMLDDDRGASTVVVRQARRLCAPANKNAEDPTAPSHPGHLTTYTIRQSAPQFTRVKGLAIADQLGTHAVDLIRPERMLVPTSKSTVATPPPLGTALDHFKCYRVRSRRFAAPNVTVETQFGALTVAIRRPRHLCLPADKNQEGIQDPRVGLMCYQVRAIGTPSAPRVFTTDQFGSADYDLFDVRDLCVPLLAGPGVCGDGSLNAPGEECETGAGNDAACVGQCDAQTCTCDTLPAPVCGDGNVDPGEQCEVATDCLVGCTARGACLTRGPLLPFTCEECQCVAAPFCGDGTVGAGEQCDDSNATCPNATDVCRECACCAPLQECPAGACGTIANGCGVNLSCGGCAEPFACSVNNLCECEGVCEFGEPDPVTCTCVE